MPPSDDHLLQDRIARQDHGSPLIQLAEAAVLRSREIRASDEPTADLLDNLASVLLAQAIAHGRLIDAYRQLEDAIDGTSTHPHHHVPRRRYAVRRAIMAVVEPHLLQPPLPTTPETPDEA